MRLKDEFRQRKIGKTGGSFRRQIPLATASGAQWVESDLEANAVIQLSFVPTLYDLITQPIIDFELAGRNRRYTPDVACIFHSNDDPFPGRFLIEVKRRAQLAKDLPKFEDGFHAAREVCKDMGAAFRILHEGHLETAYLRNAMLLRRELSTDPDYDAADLLEARFGTGSFTKREAEDALTDFLTEPWQRSEALRVMIAWREVDCDLMQDVTDETELHIRPRDGQAALRDPFLKMLQDMNSGVNI